MNEAIAAVVDNTLATAMIVAAGAAITTTLNIVRDKQRARQLKQQREWDTEDRRLKNQEVMKALAVNTDISSKAVSAANNSVEKIVAVGKQLENNSQETNRVITTLAECSTCAFQKGGPVTTGELGSVLADMRQHANALEEYAHTSVHRLNNLIQVLMDTHAKKPEEVKEPK